VRRRVRKTNCMAIQKIVQPTRAVHCNVYFGCGGFAVALFWFVLAPAFV